MQSAALAMLTRIHLSRPERGSVAASPARRAVSAEASVYFVAAEALTNVVKHARASHVRITVHHTDSYLLVEIHDDGVGGARVVAGGGLAGLADRVGTAKGELVLRSAPGVGTHLIARLPMGINEFASESSTLSDLKVDR